MAQVVKKSKEENESDVAKSLKFSRSGLDKVKEEPEEVIEEEETLNEEEEVVEEDEQEDKEDKLDATELNYRTLYEKSEAEKDKILDKVFKKEEEVKTPPPKIDIEFLSSKEISDDDFADATSSKDSFIETLNKFGNKIRTAVTDEIMNSIPGIVTNISSMQVALDSMNRKFYEENPDLVSIKKYVGTLADEMIKENGINDLSDYEKMLKELPARVRKNLKLNPPVKKKGVDSKAPKEPVLKSQRRGKEEINENLSPLQKDLQRSLKFMRERG